VSPALLLQEFQDQVGLIAVGASKGNGINRLISGGLQPSDGLVWSSMLPNIKEDHISVHIIIYDQASRTNTTRSLFF
jgi:hypothetical protein